MTQSFQINNSCYIRIYPFNHKIKSQYKIQLFVLIENFGNLKQLNVDDRS